MVRAYLKAVIVSCILLIGACNKPPCDCPPPSVNSGERKVLIACEGSLSNGNSQLTMYLPDKDSVYEDIYKSINGQALGDVFQSMQLIDGIYYLCINNSDKIIAIDQQDFKLLASCSVPKPRYILPLSNGKAYVSSLFNDKLYVLNPGSVTIEKSITLPATNTEGMALYNNHAFICTWDTAVNKIYSIDINTDQIADSYKIAGFAPQEALLDKENKLWVLSGNVTKGKRAALTRMDPFNGQIIASYEFPTSADPLRPVFNNTKDTFYFIEVNYKGGAENNGIYRMSIFDEHLPVQPFVAAKQFQYFWGLGVDPVTGNIFVGDPKGFNQKGSVTIYTPDGTQVKQFTTGVGPGHFYFD